MRDDNDNDDNNDVEDDTDKTVNGPNEFMLQSPLHSLTPLPLPLGPTRHTSNDGCLR